MIVYRDNAHIKGLKEMIKFYGILKNLCCDDMCKYFDVFDPFFCCFLVVKTFFNKE